MTFGQPKKAVCLANWKMQSLVYSSFVRRHYFVIWWLPGRDPPTALTYCVALLVSARFCEFVRGTAWITVRWMRKEVADEGTRFSTVLLIDDFVWCWNLKVRMGPRCLLVLLMMLLMDSRVIDWNKVLQCCVHYRFFGKLRDPLINSHLPFSRRSDSRFLHYDLLGAPHNSHSKNGNESLTPLLMALHVQNYLRN